MTHNEILDYAIERVLATENDSYYRARMQFKNYTPQQMQQVYSGNGETCQQVLDMYKKQYDDVNEVANYLKNLKHKEDNFAKNN